MKNINDIRREKNLYYILPDMVRISNFDLVEIKAVVVAGLFCRELLDDNLMYLRNVPDYMDICICTADSVILEKAEEFCSHRKNAFIMKIDNRKDCISSLLITCKDVFSRYEYICFIHDEIVACASEQQRQEWEFWNKNIWQNMLNSKQYIENVLDIFGSSPNIGLLVPPEPQSNIICNRYSYAWDVGFYNMVEMLERLGVRCNISRKKPPFTLGMAFWTKYEVLKKLFQWDWYTEDASERDMDSNMAISRVAERIIGYVAQDAGYDTGTVLTYSYAEQMISFMQNNLQDAFDVLKNTYNLCDYNQLKLAQKAQRRYSDQVIAGVKRFAKQYKRLYVYGAGIWAERVVEIIDDNGIELEGILVTNPEENPPYVGKYKCGVLESITDGNAGIIIAIRNAQAVEEIKNLIDEKGIFDYISIDELETGKPEETRYVKSVASAVKFSILISVHNPNLIYLSRALKSVFNQSYNNWEICIADDCSTDEKVRKYLYNLHDDRVKICMQGEKRGTSVALNAAAGMASGDYLFLMDCDGLLFSNALLVFYNEIRKCAPDIIYSDTDRINENEIHSEVFLKPQWSPDLILSQMYIGHFWGFTKSLFEKVGGFRTWCDGIQHYDMVLRMSRFASTIEHVDGVLYSARVPSSNNSVVVEDSAVLKVIQDYLDKKYGAGYARTNKTERQHIYDTVYALPEDVLVSVIVPIMSQNNVLSAQLHKLQSVCAQQSVELVIVGNIPEAVVDNCLGVLSTKENWAGLCNDGVEASSGDIIIIGDEYLDMVTSDWIERLASNAMRENVGVVGGLILNKEGLIENAGIYIDQQGWIYNMYEGISPVQYNEHIISPLTTRNVTAVSHKCMAFSRGVYNQAGGFDESSLSASVDFCVAAQNEKCWNVYLPYVKMVDYGQEDVGEKRSVDMGNKIYECYLTGGDPYYSSLVDKV